MMKLSRRAFMKDAGVLVVGFSMGKLVMQSQPQGLLSGPGNNQLDAWIAVGADGSVTAFTGKCELGQGLYTAQTQLIAEELVVAFERVRLVQCDTAATPDQGTTSGAQSHPTNFNETNLARAAATAREALLHRASDRLKAPVDQLDVSDGVITVRSAPTRRVTYGELIGGQPFKLPLNAAATRRPSTQWKILGQSTPRIEIPAMATGEFEYVHNVRVPGMLHGQVVRPPSVGATVVSVDEESVRSMAGVVKVVVKNNFIGVVAEKPWQALQAAGALKVRWSDGPSLPEHRRFYEQLRSQTPTRDTLLVDSGDVDQKLVGAARVFKASYHYPYQMHASFGTSCAVADVQDGAARLWSATQAVYPLRNSVATLLGMRAEGVRIVFRMGSGCYGVNGADTVSYDAALLSQAVSKPVRVQLTRKDEMAWENYGYASVIDQQAGIDAQGNVVVWDHESWLPVRGGRPGANNPGNIVTGFLAGYSPAAFAPRSPAPQPANFGNGSNAVPSYVTGCVGTRCGGTGRVTGERVLVHTVRSPFFTGPLRSPERLQNTFAHESFIDEIAAAVKADPAEYRLRHLADPRLVEVIRAATRAANWQPRPSPASGNRRTGVVTGRGMACVLYEGDNGYCAMVAEIEVDQGSGDIVVKRLVIANDSGPISNPDGLRNQLEGGAIHGISRTLSEEVTWDREKVTSIDWRTYRPMYFGPGVPRIETVLISQLAGRAMGAGETAVTVVAAAIGNAVFDATGARLRQVPFTPERVRSALSAR